MRRREGQWETPGDMNAVHHPPSGTSIGCFSPGTNYRDYMWAFFSCHIWGSCSCPGGTHTIYYSHQKALRSLSLSPEQAARAWPTGSFPQNTEPMASYAKAKDSRGRIPPMAMPSMSCRGRGGHGWCLASMSLQPEAWSWLPSWFPSLFLALFFLSVQWLPDILP